MIVLAVVKAAAGVVAAVVATIVAGAAAGTPLPLPVSALQILAFAAAARALLAGGGRDPRARTLAAIFLVIASSFTLRPLHALAAGGRDGSALGFPARLQVDAFLPLLVWRFFRAFPRAAETPAVAAVGRLGTALSLAVGAVLFLANLALALGAREEGPLGAPSASHDQGRDWVLSYGLALPAFALGLVRTRRAPEDERRRVTLMLAGAAFGATPVALFWPASFEAIRAGAPEDLRARVPDCPDFLAVLLLAAPDPTAARRPQSARAFAAGLRGAS